MLQISEPGQDKKRHSIGIDLGTTYSLVASAKGGKVTLVKGLGGASSLPSAVQYLSNGEKIVGREALNALEQGANNVFYSMKRLMGKGLKDVEAFQKYVPFKLEGTDEMVYAVAENVRKSAVEVASDVLKSLKHDAEISLGGFVYDAVITVPAYFNEAERAATKDAAKLAGLNVLRLISEPTAAALAYGLDKKAQGLFLVYDLGGGTFDVSLLKLTDGVFRVLATGGDTHLGGDDIDNAIAEKLNVPAYEARKIKEQVASGLAHEKLSLEELNSICMPFVARTLALCDSVLEDAEVEAENLTGVVPVGGSTRLPLIHEMLEKHLGLKPEEGIHPDEVVAHGAALQAEALSGGNRAEMLLLDVTPLSLGLETAGGLVEKVIYRNTPIPVTKAQKFTTFKDGQTGMDIHILQGERETVEGCRSLAKFRLSGIPAMVAGAPRILVIFSMDADGLLTVKAVEESTGVEQQVEVSPSYGLSNEEVLTMLKNSLVSAKADVEHRQLKESHLELERVVDACASALKIDGDMLSVTEKETLEKALDEAKTYLTSTNRDDVQTAMEKLEHAFQSFSEERVNKALKKAIVGRNINAESF